jgi:molybdopterin-containing oxidoreductase family molybdopterin binding subunit
MGLGEYFNKTEEQYIEEILSSGHPTMEGVSVERLKLGPVMAQPSDRPQQFGTPTGRIEFYVESLKQFGQELSVYIEPVESVRSEKARSYPLSLLSTHPSNRVHSTLAIVPGLLENVPKPTLQINPVDAEPRNIGDGDVVLVFNDRGQLKVNAELSNGIKPGIVNITEGWWPDQYIEGHLNQLTHDMINPVQQHILQANAAFYDVLVEVEKV